MSSLREQQAALVAALSGQGPVCEGWDAERVQALARVLAHKRMHSVGRAWPVLQALLAGRFEATFADYAAEQPLPSQGGPDADGRLFVHWLERRSGALPGDAVRRQAMAIDVRFRMTPDGLQARRGLWLGGVWLPEAGHWLLALRGPGGRTWCVPLGRAARKRRP